MSILRKMFGPSREEVWGELSRQIGGEFVHGGMWRGDQVTVKVDPWLLVLDTFVVSTGKTTVTYTRMRAPYVNRDGLRFSIYRKGFLTELAKFMGMMDLTVGDPAFDEAFVVKANDPAQVRALLSDPKLRELMMGQPSFDLTVKDDEGMFGPHFGESVDELRFAVVGVIKDIPRLKGLFDVFAATLHQLCHIGSAYESDPNLPLVRPSADHLLRPTDKPSNPDDLLRPAGPVASGDTDQLPRPADKPDN